MRLPNQILDRPVRRVLWYPAKLANEVRIPYPDRTEIVPAGTEGWMCSTIPGRHVVFYYKDGPGVTTLISDVKYNPNEFVEANYTLQSRYYEEERA